ncbi:hypothetical protein A4A49_35648 [Nicotiana attenuata]|uniref:Uncharacterized protein n=1 Tax=Nicotiana attenuata TaxID=49451 RepID=A0A1J6JWA0_NICAT|nr:hypothetical protein A4A49_35648 [Nicotiana attenuata]
MILEFFKDLCLKSGDFLKNIFPNKDQENEAQIIDFERSPNKDQENRGIDESQLRLERFKVKTPEVKSTGVGQSGPNTSSSK